MKLCEADGCGLPDLLFQLRYLGTQALDFSHEVRHIHTCQCIRALHDGLEALQFFG